jgi:hypothetical protein
VLANPVFAGARALIAFMGETGTRSRFVGVYEVRGVSTDVPSYPDPYPFPEMGVGKYYYDTAKLDGFADLEDRLVVDWGGGTRSWVQWLDPKKPKPIIELLPKGHVRGFPGYDEVLLEFQVLKAMVDHPDANRIWHRALSAVAGVYLVTDTVGGEQYVGSAYGQEGILGRWRTYAVRSRNTATTPS